MWSQISFTLYKVYFFICREWISDKAYCPTCKVPIINDTNQKRLSYFAQNNTQEVQTQNQEGESSSQVKESKPKMDSDLRKIKSYRNVVNVVRWIESQENISNDENLISSIETGAVSYSLPCAALNDRTFANEISRLQIEVYNKKILEMYEDPNKAYITYEEDLNKLRKSVSNK